jgi:diacylglycerol kinase (ATP)
MAGIGFDAHVAAATDPRSKRRWGIVAYYYSTARSVLGYSFPEFQVEGGCESLRVVACIAANSGKYGGGLVLTPDADMTDGRLDILAIQSGSRLGLLRFLVAARLGKRYSFPFLHRFRSASLRVEGPGDVLVQVDGEPFGSIPAEVSLTPCSFPLVVRA